MFDIFPNWFGRPQRNLTMEEFALLIAQANEKEHHEARNFINEFKGSHELLLKEQNNMINGLAIEVHQLSTVLNKILLVKQDLKGITTRGGKSTFQIGETPEDDSTNKISPESISSEQEQPKETNPEPVIREEPSVELKQSTLPFPHRVRKEKEDAYQRKFLENLKQLQLSIPFMEALVQMPKYAKYLKSLLTNKSKLEEACTVTMGERSSAALLNKLPSKEKDPGSFTIPCQIKNLHIGNALADLGASISLMPSSMYEKLGLGEPKPTRMCLELADRSIQYPLGIAENILIKVDKFELPIDFVILDMPENSRTPIILGRPFLATARAMIDVFNKKITLTIGKDEVEFNMEQSMSKTNYEDDECYNIDVSDDTINQFTQKLLKSNLLDSFLLKNLENTIAIEDQVDENTIDNNFAVDSAVCNAIRRIGNIDAAHLSDDSNDVIKEQVYSASANNIDDVKPVLKDLPSTLEYAYLNGNTNSPVIIASDLTPKEKESLLQVLYK